MMISLILGIYLLTVLTPFVLMLDSAFNIALVATLSKLNFLTRSERSPTLAEINRFSAGRLRAVFLLCVFLILTVILISTGLSLLSYPTWLVALWTLAAFALVSGTVFFYEQIRFLGLAVTLRLRSGSIANQLAIANAEWPQTNQLTNMTGTEILVDDTLQYGCTAMCCKTWFCVSVGPRLRKTETGFVMDLFHFPFLQLVFISAGRQILLVKYDETDVEEWKTEVPC